MNTVLASICSALFFAVAPALVLAHYIWPRRIGWWAVAVISGSFGWLLLVLGEHFTERAWKACEMTIIPGAMADSMGGCTIVHFFPTYNLQLGWLKALIYMIPWVAVFGVVRLVQRRRTAVAHSPPNKSLERTREG
jgi:hypothetical protein